MADENGKHDSEEESQGIPEDYIQAGAIILRLLEESRHSIDNALMETKEERVDSIEKTKAVLEKHIGEKAFLASRQKESMAKAAKMIGGELGEIVKKLDKEIGIKAFLSANAREREAFLKKIEISPEHFRATQEKIEATVATHAMASDRIRKSGEQMKASKEERVQRMKEAGDALERSDALTTRALRAEKQKQQQQALGDKGERQQKMKDAAEQLEKDPAFVKKTSGKKEEE